MDSPLERYVKVVGVHNRPFAPMPCVSRRGSTKWQEVKECGASPPHLENNPRSCMVGNGVATYFGASTNHIPPILVFFRFLLPLLG